MNENTTIEGIVEWELRGPNGEIKSAGKVRN